MLLQGSGCLSVLLCHFSWKWEHYFQHCLMKLLLPTSTLPKSGINSHLGNWGLEKHDRKVVLLRGEARIQHQGNEPKLGWGRAGKTEPEEGWAPSVQRPVGVMLA